MSVGQSLVDDFLKYVLAQARLKQVALGRVGVDETIIAQINFMMSVFSGQDYDRSRLFDINVGLIGMREIAEFDPAFADLLSVIQYLADQKSRGLKVDQNVVLKYFRPEGSS